MDYTTKSPSTERCRMNTVPVNSVAHKQWRRTESKTIRPFQHSDEVLSATGFRLSDDFEFQDGVDVFQNDGLIKSQLAPEFLIKLSAIDIENSLGLNADLLKLVISVEDKALKQIIVFHESNHFDDEEIEIKVPQDVVNRLSWSGDTKFTIAIVLADDREPVIGQASEAGQWLAKKIVSVIKERHTASFPFEVISRDEFEKKGLPKDTTYFVDIFLDDFNDPDVAMNEMVKIFVNETVVSVMNKAEETASGRALLLNIYCDAAASILDVGYAKLKSVDQLQEGSVLHTVSDKLSASTGVSIEDIFAMTKRLGGGCRLRSLLQSECQLTKTLTSATFTRSA